MNDSKIIENVKETKSQNENISFSDLDPFEQSYSSSEYIRKINANKDDDDVFSDVNLNLFAPKPNPTLVPFTKSKQANGAGHHKESPAPELLYANQRATDKFIAVEESEESSLVYKWDGSHWVYQSEQSNDRHAFEWLEKKCPSRATKKTASSCTATAKLKLQQLPCVKTQDVIIPFKGMYLKIQPDGTIMAQPPGAPLGIKYLINAPAPKQTGPYTPADLPPDSLFAQFLATGLPDPEKQALIQEYAGYTLLGDTRFQKCLLLLGPGEDGKSTFANIIRAMHGKAVALSLDKLEGFQLSAIKDASLVISEETPRHGINEQVFKTLVSGGVIQIEKKHKDPYTYAPYAKIIVCCNEFPRIKDKSNGFWRRIIFINWVNSMPSDKKIFDLDKKIIESELHLVIDWALQGLQRLLKRGNFDVPESIKQDLAQEREAEDSVAQFLAEVPYKVCANNWTAKKRIYHDYVEFCGSSYTVYGNAQFWKSLSFKFKFEEKREVVNGNRIRCVNLAKIPW